MNYYLGPWQWVESEPGEGYFAPPEGALALDLRNTEQCSKAGVQDGFGLFATDGTLKDYDLLGSGHLSEIRTGGKLQDTWESLLGYRPNGDTLGDLLWGHLTAGADPAGESTCKPLVPRADRWIELLLGERVRAEKFTFGTHPHTNRLKALLQRDLERVRADSESGKLIDPVTKQADTSYHRRVMLAMCEKYRCQFADLKPRDWPISDTPLVHRTTITESFNTSDGDTLGPDLTWAEVDGDWDIVSNQAAMVSNFGSTMRDARAESDLSSTDHYAQATHIIGSRIGGVCTRFASAAETAYIGYTRVVHGSNGICNVSKVVAGTLTSLADSSTHNNATAFTIRSESNGSTIRTLHDGAEEASLTDTSITSGTRCGLAGYDPTGSGSSDPLLDAFEAGDLGAATGQPASKRMGGVRFAFGGRTPAGARW